VVRPGPYPHECSATAELSACDHPIVTELRYDADVASVASLIADPTRAAMLLALTDADSLSISELARRARVSLSTASEHVRRLEQASLLRSARHGRARFVSLAGPDVATVLESLAALAGPAPVRSLHQSIAASRLAMARTCYDHLAGRLGVAILEDLLRDGSVVPLRTEFYDVTRRGEQSLSRLSVDLSALRRGRRALARGCTDWTEHRPHLGGALGAAICGSVLDRRWVTRADRVLEITETGREGFTRWLGADSRVVGLIEELRRGAESP
jgi:DNA-binding transcriptional ArsR family regulator